MTVEMTMPLSLSSPLTRTYNTSLLIFLLQDATDLTVLPRLVRFLYARRQPPLAKMYPEGPAI